MAEPIRFDPAAFYLERDLREMGLRDGSIARARRDGALKYTRRGGRILYRGDWLERWLTGSPESELAGVSSEGR